MILYLTSPCTTYSFINLTLLYFFLSSVLLLPTIYDYCPHLFILSLIICLFAQYYHYVQSGIKYKCHYRVTSCSRSTNDCIPSGLSTGLQLMHGASKHSLLDHTYNKLVISEV